jgi:cysteine synthase A
VNASIDASSQTLNVLGRMGLTPLHRLNSSSIVSRETANVYVKLEEFNPGESVKSRVALSMVRDAESRGLLRPFSGQTIIEPTGGNTGTGLALVGAQRGYRVVLVVPDNYVSPSRLKLLRLRGAEVLLSDHRQGNDSHVRMVRELVNQNSSYVWLDQFSNPANPGTHYETTGLEIVQALAEISCFVAGIGSGGTITGVGRRLRERFPQVEIVGVQPAGCDALNGSAIPHRIQGLSVGFVPPVLDRSLVDRMLSITFEEALGTIRLIARAEGLFVGLSSGANICAALKLARQLPPSAAVVTISCDSGKNYPDVLLFESEGS